MPGISAPGDNAIRELGRELETMFDGVRPDIADVERAFDSIEVPEADNLQFEASVVPDMSLDASEADLLLNTDGEIVDEAALQTQDVVEIALEQNNGGSEILLDAGDEVIEIVVEVVAEALEGV